MLRVLQYTGLRLARVDTFAPRTAFVSSPAIKFAAASAVLAGSILSEALVTSSRVNSVFDSVAGNVQDHGRLGTQLV